MRRRSERRKSSDVSSPAPAASRRTNRRRKSPSVSEDDKTTSQNNEVNDKKTSDIEERQDSDRDSSEERVENKRSRRSSRSIRTPVREQEQQKTSPIKRRIRRDTTPENNIPPIQEEDTSAVIEEVRKDEQPDKMNTESSPQAISEVAIKNNDEPEETRASSPCNNYDEKDLANKAASPIREQTPKITVEDDETRSSVKTDKENVFTEDTEDKDDPDEVKLHTRDNSPRSGSNSSSEQKQPLSPIKIMEEEAEDGEVVEVVDKEEKKPDEHSFNNIAKNSPKMDKTSKLEEVNYNQDGKTNETSNTKAAADTGRDVSISIANTNKGTLVRKRRWITKKASESNKEPIMAISTDSLKNLIADVHPVPLSDVQLDSSSDVEEVTSEREEGEQSPSPEPERRRGSIERFEITIKRQQSKESHRQAQIIPMTVTGPLVQRLPSPARNHSSCVLYITNLVRPFTVLQLKGLLARTGKIVEDGFWIDRIKSKCFVEYENEDEAIETRHALHGVRWPASNPKCLNVDFGSKSDMLKAIELTKADGPKFGHETNKDNLMMGSGWGRERHDDDKKGPRPVREWDVGKKENLDRDLKALRDMERRRDRSREKERDNSKNRGNDRIERDRNEHDRNDRERERRRRNRENRSMTLSPARKHKKKDDPPLRLLDDLFRKTKVTPYIYWLPLTPEQIAEKEALRVKRVEEQKQRLKQREMEREKERERERERNRQNDRERDRDNRRPRSNDRRRTRSRDRRRY